MRSKAPLALIEQAVMLAVFALAAVLCLKAFVWADLRSAENAGADRALLQAQSAAETLKNCRGDCPEAAGIMGGMWDGTRWSIRYDENWAETDGEAAYLLQATPLDTAEKYLGSAQVEVLRGEVVLTSLTVNWQEVGEHE